MRKPIIVLASASPRRKEILKKHGIDAIVIPSQVEEILPEELCATNLPSLEQEVVDRGAVQFLSRLKADWVADKILAAETDFVWNGEDEVKIIGADTLVFKDEKLGKPRNRDEAREMIKSIQGSSHKVITGVTVITLSKNGKTNRKTETFSDETIVRCKPMTDEEIEAYIATDEPYDKAGGYAIQGEFGQYIEAIRGDFENVMGLPWHLLKYYVGN